jgi:hypothetical protein
MFLSSIRGTHEPHCGRICKKRRKVCPSQGLPGRAGVKGRADREAVRPRSATHVAGMIRHPSNRRESLADLNQGLDDPERSLR